jgi:MinD-like ATPase involved in chromosome partitioning or flagellar assembly
MLTKPSCKNTFILVGADKGGVGKTTFSRLLLEYLAQYPCSMRVFDTEPGPGVLRRFWPSAEQINLADPIDQAKVIDGLGAARVTLVDIRAGLLSPTLHLFQRIGLEHGVEAHLAVFHVLGNTIASFGEIATTAAMLKNNGDHIIVKNHTNAGAFVDVEDKIASLGPETNIIDIGNLEAVAAERVDQRSQTFADFTSDKTNSRTIRGITRSWYDASFAELNQAGVNALVS